MIIADGNLDASLWLGRQRDILTDIFDRAATELGTSGIRLLTGSLCPKLEECDCAKRIAISPLRFSSGEEFVSLSLAADARGGPPRYVVLLKIRGFHPLEAFHKLGSQYAELCGRAYLMTGLWISDAADWRLLNHLGQLSVARADLSVRIGGTFLHSDMPRTIQDGFMLVGVLYRSLLDELSGAGKMARLYSRFTNSLDGRRPSFRRMIRP